MYTREKRVLLRHYLEQGVGKTELARRFGVSRRSIYYWIKTCPWRIGIHVGKARIFLGLVLGDA